MYFDICLQTNNTLKPFSRQYLQQKYLNNFLGVISSFVVLICGDILSQNDIIMPKIRQDFFGIQRIDWTCYLGHKSYSGIYR